MARNDKSENSWERQPGETVQAFEACDLYCKSGDERSIRKVAQKLGKSQQLLSRWSSKWNWQSRSRDYDNEIKRKEVQAQKKAYQAMQQRQIGMAVQLQKKAFEALKDLPVESLTPKDIKEFMKLGTELERLNLAPEKSGDTDNGKTSLADAIVEAYKRRTGGE